MRKTRLNLALFSAFALLGSSQAFAELSATHGVVVLNKDTYTTQDYNNAPASLKYEERTITSHFLHYNDGVDASGVNLHVIGGKAHRIYAAMIGHEALIAGDAALRVVSNNRITVDSLDLNSDMGTVTVIGGGSVYHGLATENHVQIKNVEIEDVYGGLSHHGSANKNTVFVGESVKATLSGTKYYGLIVGGLVNSTKADKNVYQDSERTNDNSVVIDTHGNDFLGAAIGGSVRADADHDGHANRNTVTLESGWLALVYGAESANGNVNNNTVIINGGLVAPHPKGSENLPPGIIGGTSDSGEVRYNHVFINGGEIAVNVYAGSGAEEKTIITDNQITVAGNADLTEASLWGSNLPGGERNALNLLTKQQVKQVGNFNIYNFNIGPSLQASDTLLLVEDGNGTNTTDISNATLNVYIDKDAKRLNPGEKITLISDSDGLVATDFEGNIILADPIKDYRVCFNLEDNTDLVLTVFESRISPRTQSLLKGNLTRLASVNQAGDLVADAGTNALVDAANSGRQWFVAMQGGSNHYNMDSYIDLDGQSVMFGGALSGEAWGGHLSVGAFVEGGWADYEMLDQFDNGSTMKGKGETDYRGAGLLAYYGKVVDDNRSWWAEASVRVGRADLTYVTQDWVPGFDYDLSGNYFAAHVGAGYRYALSPTQSLNLFTKAFYNRQASEDFMIETNPIEFDAMESMRWRAGVAYEQLTQTASGTRFFWKTSLAYEYEFEAVARGRADGYQIQESDLTGSSGVAEFAMTVVPVALPNTDFKVAVQGYAGQREGVLGQVRLTHRF